MKKIVIVSLIIMAMLSFSMCYAFEDDVLLSVPADRDEYAIYQNGIVAIDLDGAKIYVKPINSMKIARRHYLFMIVPIREKFGNPVPLYTRIGSFEIQILLSGGTREVAFDPYAVGLTVNGQAVPIKSAQSVQLMKESSARSSRGEPYKRGNGYLFSYEECSLASIAQRLPAMQILSSGHDGYVVRFDCVPPIPGKDVFCLSLPMSIGHSVAQVERRIIFDDTSVHSVSQV